MLIHLADGHDIFLDFRETAPGAATPTMFQDDNGTVVKGRSTQTWLGVGVPGTVMGLEAARTKYGSMSRQQRMQPAIALAPRGEGVRQGADTLCHTRRETSAPSPK